MGFCSIAVGNGFTGEGAGTPCLGGFLGGDAMVSGWPGIWGSGTGVTFGTAVTFDTGLSGLESSLGVVTWDSSVDCIVLGNIGALQCTHEQSL